MTIFIELICICGATWRYKRQLLYDNKHGSVRCHVCGDKYSASDILTIEKNGIAEFKGEENGI